MALFVVDTNWYPALLDLSQSDKGYMLDIMFRLNQGESVDGEVLKHANPALTCAFKIMKASFMERDFNIKLKRIKSDKDDSLLFGESDMGEIQQIRKPRVRKPKIVNKFPTLEQIAEYITQRTNELGLTEPIVDAERFFRYYSLMDWQYKNKAGELKPVQNWKLKVCDWEQRALKNAGVDDIKDRQEEAKSEKDAPKRKTI